MARKVKIDWEKDENVEWQDYTPRKREGKDHKRHLLITTDNFLPRWDGISRFLSEIVPRLEEKYYITVVAPDYGPIRVKGVHIVQLPLRKREFGDYTPAKPRYGQIKELVKQADLVFNQGLGPIGLYAIIASRTTRTPIVSYIHNVEWELFPKALASPLFRGPLVSIAKILTRFLYNLCTLLILPSENIAEQLSWQRITTEKRIAHLGVDTKKFKKGDSKKVRDKLGLPKNAFIVGFHGRIAYEKNLLTLLRGFRRLKVKDKHLVIVGDGVEAIKSKLKRFKDVTVTGTTEGPEEWLQAMDVYVMPSFTETTSLAVLEAMACGLPVISSKVGFIKYYIIENENGMFFDNENPYDLMEKIFTVHEDMILRRKLGINARKTIEKSFQWDMTAEKIKDALDEV